MSEDLIKEALDHARSCPIGELREIVRMGPSQLAYAPKDKAEMVAILLPQLREILKERENDD